MCTCICFLEFVLCLFFSSRRRHTRCALVTGVQTCALPIYGLNLEAFQPLGWREIIRGGAVMDSAQLERCLEANIGDLTFAEAFNRTHQIGRASCRERVSQYV